MFRMVDGNETAVGRAGRGAVVVVVVVVVTTAGCASEPKTGGGGGGNGGGGTAMAEALTSTGSALVKVVLATGPGERVAAAAEAP